jgi:UDP-N-acetyl-D-mannosaminuronic acid dehydrogenase
MIKDIKTVSVIGLGYIGLPTAALLANSGYKVFGMDANPSVVNTINKGEIHIVEPELDVVVRAVVAEGHLKAFSDVQVADVYILCVPTPFYSNEDIRKPNLEYVMSAASSICNLLKSGDILILESTSPVGTTKLVEKFLDEAGVDTSKIHIAYCPERVLPGKIMRELITNDRIVGGITDNSSKIVSKFYSSFVKGLIHETDCNTAEMCKLAENSFRDVNLAFANELSIICDGNEVNVRELIKLANHHPRVNILSPGTGVGGHCIAVDPWFIVASDPGNARLIHQARCVNDSKPDWVVNKITSRLRDLSGHVKVACLGLSFKPDIDDLRESPAMLVVEKLISSGVDLVCVEPNIKKHEHIPLIPLEDALLDYDVIAVLVNHKQFRDPLVRSLLASKDALDFCGVFE